MGSARSYAFNGSSDRSGVEPLSGAPGRRGGPGETPRDDTVIPGLTQCGRTYLALYSIPQHRADVFMFPSRV